MASPARPLVSSPDWNFFLNGSEHPSYIPSQTVITPANAPGLVQNWDDFPTTVFFSSPTVYDGSVYIGSDQGWFYQLDESTGAVLHKRFVGSQPKLSCPARGFVPTATVTGAPVTHEPTVYVAGPDGYLYALRASNLTLEWKSVIAIPSTTTSNYFDWSSPTIAKDTIYVGVSSNCDHPLVRAGVIAYNQANGKQIAEFYTVPKGDIGGSVWSSVAAIYNGDVFATTGNGPEGSPTSQRLGYSESILKLAPRTLKLLGRFQVPAAQVTYDGDFGASPVIVGDDVGACNKNGIFYMLSQATMKVVWEERLGSGCISSPVVDGSRLFLGGESTTIAGVSYGGSMQERDAATGALVWETGLAGAVLGSPAMDGGGVISVPIYNGSTQVPSMYLIDAASGAILDELPTGMADFAQGVFAESQLFTANAKGVQAWRPKS